MTEHLSDTKFASLTLDPTIMAGVRDVGFEHCTPIQAQALPLALAGQDVAGQAQTGTGKTAAFLLAMFQYLLTQPADEHRRPNQPRAFILAPTRELAVQIHKDAEVLGAHTGLTLGLAYGGEAYEKQRDQIAAGVDVLIGTPGRLIDYFKQHVFDLRAVQVLVLDEADRMFDMGFIKDIRFLLRRLPSPTERLNMLFSATLSFRVMELAYEHMNNPKSVEVEPEQVTADRVRQILYMPATDEKIPLLVGLMRQIDPKRTMVFVNTKRAADMVTDYLESNGFRAEPLSGDVPQNKRLRLLREFEAGTLPVLVTTDVASRGLHIPEVSHVINFDLPQDAEDYVHRIGRTARAGAEGDAISFACEEYAYSLPDIEKYIGMSIPREMDHSPLLVDVGARVRKKREKVGPPGGGRSGGGGGRRRSSSRSSRG